MIKSAKTKLGSLKSRSDWEKNQSKWRFKQYLKALKIMFVKVAIKY